MPTVEFHPTLDRRELASIQAGLRLLRWSAGADKRLLPHDVCRMLDEMASDSGAIEPLSDVEIRELAVRLGS